VFPDDFFRLLQISSSSTSGLAYATIPQARTPATPNAAMMGKSKMMGVPMNKPKISDKTVVGSRVEADNSTDDEVADERAAVKEEDKESMLSKEEASEFTESGSMFCVDGVVRALVCI
jgi:hypothetical protein